MNINDDTPYYSDDFDTQPYRRPLQPLDDMDDDDAVIETSAQLAQRGPGAPTAPFGPPGGPFGPGLRPPFGFPTPGFPPFGPGPGPGPVPPLGPPSRSGPPSGPPPSFIPSQPFGARAVDPGAIRNCLFRFTYVWPERGRPFWFFPTFVGRNSVSGFRWNGFMWVFFGTDLRNISSFQCV